MLTPPSPHPLLPRPRPRADYPTNIRQARCKWARTTRKPVSVRAFPGVQVICPSCRNPTYINLMYCISYDQKRSSNKSIAVAGAAGPRIFPGWLGWRSDRGGMTVLPPSATGRIITAHVDFSLGIGSSKGWRATVSVRMRMRLLWEVCLTTQILYWRKGIYQTC